MSYRCSQYIIQEDASWLWNTLKNCLMALIISVIGTDATITVSPKNTVALKSQQVILSCSTDLSFTLEWKLKNVLHQTPTTIYDGYKVNPEFDQYYSINRSLPGQFDIVVKNPDREIAMLHQCIESDGSAQKTRSAELVILETRPECKQYFDFSKVENVTMLCHVNYSGNWPPTMKWTSNGNDYTNMANLKIIRDEFVWSMLTIPRKNIANDQNYTCRTKFTSDVYNGTASERNVPDYVQDCLVTPVKYQISEPTCYILTIFDDSDDKNMILRCLANYSGSLTPVIEWIVNNENFTKHAQIELIPDTRITSTLKLPLKDVKDEQELICQVMFGGCGRECIHECIVIVPNGVNAISSQLQNHHGCTVPCAALIVLVVLFIALIILIILFIYKPKYIYFFRRMICSEAVAAQGESGGRSDPVSDHQSQPDATQGNGKENLAMTSADTCNEDRNTSVTCDKETNQTTLKSTESQRDDVDSAEIPLKDIRSDDVNATEVEKDPHAESSASNENSSRKSKNVETDQTAKVDPQPYPVVQVLPDSEGKFESARGSGYRASSS